MLKQHFPLLKIIHIAENGDIKVDEPKAAESVKKTLYVKYMN